MVKKKPMPDRVTEYAKLCASGALGMGELHVLACQRHLNDLARQRTPDFPYYWDQDSADRVLDFAETLTIAEGSEPRPVELLGCQAFDIGSRFGWKRLDGFRRFRRSYKSVSRQQGKTFENGIMGTYISGFSGYRYGKCFTVATRKRQSKLAWDEMKKFIESDADLSEMYKIQEYCTTITSHVTQCTVEALSKEGGLQDGFRALFASVDELHQYKDNGIYKAIYNGTRQLDETLVSMITTRGSDLNSFCKEMDDYAIQILRGTATAEDFFVDIYCLDPQDDPFDETVWKKACPLTCAPGREVALQTLRQDAQTARDMGGSDLRDFMTKSLNLWVQNTDDIFINPDHWKACASDRTLEDFRGSDVYVGLDLSSGGDLTSMAIEVPYTDAAGRGAVHFYTHSYMPRGRMQEHVETDLAPYDMWEAMELITVTGTSSDYITDYKYIIRELKQIIDRYDLHVLGIGIDPHNAAAILTDLDDIGATVVPVTQSARNLNDATVDFQLQAKSGTLSYNRHEELLTWSVLNAEVVRNSFDEIKVDKREKKRKRRIDSVDACICAHHMVRQAKAAETPLDGDESVGAWLDLMGLGGE